jgi:hypothetical protein
MRIGITSGVISVVLTCLLWQATPIGRSKISVLDGISTGKLADMQEQTSAVFTTQKYKSCQVTITSSFAGFS